MKKIRNLQKYVCLVAVAATGIFLVSCEKEQSFQPQYLSHYSAISTLSGSQIVQLAAQSTMLPQGTVFLVKYGVSAYKVEYKTDNVDGSPIVASGLLLVPQTAATVPLLSFQHGTLFEKSQAPSNFNSDLTNMLTVMASMGYVIAVPDYIGYGSSSSLLHPYEHRQSLATSCRDMIRASKEYFLIDGSTNVSAQLFLAGYSEGGFASMALFKLLQEQHATELPVTAVSAGAGAYNKTQFAKWILGQNQPINYINYFLWVLDTYNRFYPNLNRPVVSYFNLPWAEAIAQQGPLVAVEPNPQLLFKASFIQNVTDGTDTQFLGALADNDCFNWRPLAPLKLIHGTADELVPYFNSLSAYDAMVLNGATQVSLVPVAGGTHESTVTQFALETLLFFGEFK